MNDKFCGTTGWLELLLLPLPLPRLVVLLPPFSCKADHYIRVEEGEEDEEKRRTTCSLPPSIPRRMREGGEERPVVQYTSYLPIYL